MNESAAKKAKKFREDEFLVGLGLLVGAVGFSDKEKELWTCTDKELDEYLHGILSFQNLNSNSTCWHTDLGSFGNSCLLRIKTSHERHRGICVGHLHQLLPSLTITAVTFCHLLYGKLLMSPCLLSNPEQLRPEIFPTSHTFSESQSH